MCHALVIVIFMSFLELFTCSAYGIYCQFMFFCPTECVRYLSHIYNARHRYMSCSDSITDYNYVFIAAANNVPRQIGSVSDIDPANGVYGSVDQNSYRSHQQHHANRLPQQQQLHQPQPSPQKSAQKSLSTKVKTVPIHRN